MKYLSTLTLSGMILVLASAPASAQSVAAILEEALVWIFGGM